MDCLTIIQVPLLLQVQQNVRLEHVFYRALLLHQGSLPGKAIKHWCADIAWLNVIYTDMSSAAVSTAKALVIPSKAALLARIYARPSRCTFASHEDVLTIVPAVPCFLNCSISYLHASQIPFVLILIT